MDFILNGEQRDFQGDPEGTLLDYLREHEGIITAKKGCNDEAACGCCAVQVDSKGILSCVTKMSRMEGKSVTTVDGLDQRLQEAFADAFVEKGGIQCGFCIPGFVMQAKVLLDKNPDPTREEVVKAFNMNLCRCTGYVKIVDSILEAAQAIRENKPVPQEDTTGRVGKTIPQIRMRYRLIGISALCRRYEDARAALRRPKIERLSKGQGALNQYRGSRKS